MRLACVILPNNAELHYWQRPRMWHVKTKYSLRGDVDLNTPDKVIARNTYERMVASGGYQYTEAMQDSMMGLKLLYKAILGKKMRVEDIPDFENAYVAENLMSSQNAAMQQEY